MKYIVLLSLLFAANAHAVQINLDCVDENGETLASVYTPEFVYNQTQVKANLELDGELVELDVPFVPSAEVPGVYVGNADGLTLVGIAKTSVFAPKAELRLDVLQNGLSVLTLNCETTVNNPTFPRD